MSEEGDDDKESKTEEPTQRRLEQAIEKGQVINSREVTTFIVIMSITLIIVWLMPYIGANLGLTFKSILEHCGEIESFQYITYKIFTKAVLLGIAPMIFIGLMVILFTFIQQGQISFSFEPISPDISKLSPIKGFKRIFSMKSLVELFKNVLKVVCVGYILYATVKKNIYPLDFYPELSIDGLIHQLIIIVTKLLFSTCIILAFFAGIDYLYQRHEYMKSLRMSKEEMKEEFKQTEGSPEIKRKLQSLRQEKAKNRASNTVPKADVIVTNPTHYSVALKYDPNIMNAPKVIAKGQDSVALYIRKIAEQHEIPIVENPPLARSLYNTVPIDYEIPVEHYEAVAEIIRYVYNASSRKK